MVQLIFSVKSVSESLLRLNLIVDKCVFMMFGRFVLEN